MRKSMRRSMLTALLAAGAALMPHEPSLGQSAPVDMLVVRSQLDSGELQSDLGIEAVVFSQIVHVPGAPWLRLVFDDARLAGKSRIVIQSLHDGEVQVLDSEGLAQWQHSSAFFNGSAVLIEVIAAPGTKGSRIALSRVIAGNGGPVVVDRSVCSATDSRVPATDARVARLIQVPLPIPDCPGAVLPCNPVRATICSGFLIDTPLADDANNRVMLSAGHCFDAGDLSQGSPGALCTVAQFGAIPNTDSGTCAMAHPPVARQFPINPSRIRYSNAGPCLTDDWAAFTCFPSGGQTPFQAQGAAFSLAAAAPANGAALRKIGCGAAGPASVRFCNCVIRAPESARWGTQQTAVGTVTAPVNATHLIRHNVHTCGGDSGCALIDGADQIVGIHTAGGCNANPSPPNNCGVSVLNPNVQMAIAQVAGSNAPNNDACARAQTIGDGLTAYSTVGATTDGPLEPAFAGLGGSDQIDRDVWFRFVAPANARRIISLCDATFDTRLAIYVGSCPINPGTALAVNDDSDDCGPLPTLKRRSRLTTPVLVAGNAYLIRVGGYNNQTGTGNIAILPTVPVNNTCANRSVVGEGHHAFSTVGATTDGPGETTCGGGDVLNDVWFAYQAPVAGRVEFRTCGATSFDTCLVLYDYNFGSMTGCPPGALRADGDDQCATLSAMTRDVAAGDTFLIRVGGKQIPGRPAGSGYTGNGTLIITAIRPSNDNCADAVVVAAATPTNVVTDGATNEAGIPDPVCGSIARDVWFRYTAAAAGVVTADLCSPTTPVPWDTNIAVYNDSCTIPGPVPMPGDQMLIACNDDACGVQSRVEWNAAAGTTYLIRVGSRIPNASGTGTLIVSAPIAAGSPPGNDTCGSAFWMHDGFNDFASTNATTNAGLNPTVCMPALAGSNDHILGDVWYKYRVARPGNVIVDGCGLDFDARMVSYNGPCGGLVQVSCADDDCGVDDNRPRMNMPVTPVGPATPRDYLVRVGRYQHPLPMPDGPAPAGGGTLRVRFLPNDTLASTVANYTQDNPAGGPSAVIQTVRVGDGSKDFDSTGADTDPGALMPIAPCEVGGMPPPPNPDTIAHDLFYIYRASNTGNTSFSVCAAFSNIIVVSSTAGVTLGCDRANADCGGGATRSTVTIATTAGTAYIIRLGGRAADEMGQGTLTITPTPSVGPANNDCFSAQAAVLGSNPFTTVGATLDGVDPAPCPAPQGNTNFNSDIWFTHTAARTGTLIADLCSADFDTRLGVYPIAACPQNNAPTVCGDDDCGPGNTRSRVRWQVTAGQLYRIRVGGFGGQTGTGSLDLRFLNDTCAGAQPIFEGSTPFNNAEAATDGAAHMLCDFFGNDQITGDLFWVFIPPVDGRVRFDTLGSAFDTKLAVDDLTPGCGALAAPAACNDDFDPPNRWSRIVMDVTAGTPYLIRAGGYNSATGNGVVNIKFTRNNACAQATVISNGSHFFDTTDATADGTASCGTSNATGDVWFRYTASCTGDLVLNLCNSSYDTVVSVYTGACGALVEVPGGCNDDGFQPGCIGTRSYLAVPVTAATEYHIRVSGFNGQTGNGTLEVRCRLPGACCAGATCTVVNGSACTGMFKLFTDGGTACNPPNDVLTPCCKADFNQSGVVSVQDLFDFLSSYFAGNLIADISGDMALTVTDIFDFLGAFFSGC